MKPSDSLCNASVSPGWNEEEIKVLRLAIMKFGLGNWTELIEGGYLPGKSISQLNNQVRRMLGQQSSAEFAGLHIDVSKIGEMNRTKEGLRKCGVLIHTGAKLTRQEILLKIQQNKLLYELQPEEYESIQLDELKIKEDILLVQMKQLRMLRKELQEVEQELVKFTKEDLNSLPISSINC